MASQLLSKSARALKLNAAATPWGTVRVSMTRTVFGEASAACREAMTMLELLGSTTTASPGQEAMASRIWAVLGFMVWPPSTIAAPRLWKISAKPAPGATATKSARGATTSGSTASIFSK